MEVVTELLEHGFIIGQGGGALNRKRFGMQRVVHHLQFYVSWSDGTLLDLMILLESA